MKDKNIKETFEFFAPSEERKEILYKEIMNRQNSRNKRRGRPFRARLVYSFAAACVILALGAVVVLGNSNRQTDMQRAADKTQYEQTETVPSGIALPPVADDNDVFKGFVLTAYRAGDEAGYLAGDFLEDAEKQVLAPGVKTLLARYSPAMSSVPGFPFTVEINGDNVHKIDAINVSARSGGLNKWDRDTGIVSNEGQTAVIEAGETIYWTPIFGDDADNIENITITVEAITGGAVAGRQCIYITQDEPGYYSATVGELESKI